MQNNQYFTSWEDVSLPSKGLIYDKKVNPKIRLRSMTTAEEMKRLSPTDTPYKVMSDMIEDCMQEKPAIHVHDMCLGDYQYLLHRLRVVTYGPEYKMTVKCPHCEEITESIADLDSLKVNEFNEEISNLMHINLPVTGKEIELKFQTPRDLDLVSYRSKEMKKQKKNGVDYSMLFNIMSLIKKVDGVVLNDIALQEFVKNLPLKDTSLILTRAIELNKKVGLDTTISVKCSNCGEELTTTFRHTPEFFGPTNY